VSGPLLVTGASGYLGSELLRQDPSAVASPRSSELDVRDAAGVARFFEQVLPTAVIHTAYRQDGEGAYEITAVGARHVAAASRAVGARLIHMSTDVLFDGTKEGPYTEDDPPSPITGYGRAKAAAEAAVRDAHPDALLVRTSLIYTGDGSSRHERAALAVARGELDTPFFVDELRCPVQVSDLARALLELVDDDSGGVLHVAGEEVVSRYEFACLVAARGGFDPERIRADTIAGRGLARPRNCALDSSRARLRLGTRLRGAREVLAARPGPN
jgi:dTDP-4-dehydrorhamnose reductase